MADDDSSWSALQALESETTRLLQTVRGTSAKPSRHHGKENDQHPGDRTSKGRPSTAVAGGSSRKRMSDDTGHAQGARRSRKRSTFDGVAGGGGDTFTRKTALLELSQSVDGMARTRNLYSAGGNGGGRVTVEVLDDAGEDATPRDDAMEKRDALRRHLLETQMAQLQATSAAEALFRGASFERETRRVTRRDDTFVPAPTVNVYDVNRERTRLEKLEESARVKARAAATEADTRREFLQQDKAAVKLQALFRGSLGRQKFNVVKRLKDLEDTGTDWVEVRDRESGDQWYYNKRTGVSQWERPDEMKGTLSRQAQLKKLPAAGAGGIAASASTASISTLASTGAERVRTAPAGASRAFTAATTLPSLDGLSRAKSAATATATASDSLRARRVSFNQTMEVNTGSKTIEVAMPGEQPASLRRTQTPSTGQRARPTAAGGSGAKAVRPMSSPAKMMGGTADSAATEVLNWEEEQARERAREQVAARDVEKIMQLEKIMPAANLLDPGGAFKPHLRTAVLDALLTTRFDSMSTVVAESEWTDRNANPFRALEKRGALQRPGTTGGQPFGRAPHPLLSLGKVRRPRTPLRYLLLMCTLRPFSPSSPSPPSRARWIARGGRWSRSSSCTRRTRWRS